MKNQVQLVAYVDRLGGASLRELRALLQGPLAGLFGGVHLLPFFHPIDGADAGFDPIDHTCVDPRLGDWADVSALAADVDVMADVIVNHVSSSSPPFLDVLERGAESGHDGLFLRYADVFPDGASEEELLSIYRPRPGLPFTAVALRSGERRLFWTTFTAGQIDIDVEGPAGRAYLEGILDRFQRSGIRMVRLDAVGYAIKRAGTSCFMIPETYAFIEQFAARARARGIEVLVEIHAHHHRQIDIAARVDWVYDFALPPLVLHAFQRRSARALKTWLAIRPTNALVVLDTHDGIGIVDIGEDATDRAGHPGLVPPEELGALVEWIHANCAGQSRAATGTAASNLDVYQVNCTYFDALGRDEHRYVAARALQFFVPGIPQVYYVGLLSGGNDMALLARTGVGRDINRHYYARDEIESALQTSVVRRLLDLIRMRNEHPAFSGSFRVEPSGDDVLDLRWAHGDARARLRVDFAAGDYQLDCTPAAPVTLGAVPST